MARPTKEDNARSTQINARVSPNTLDHLRQIAEFRGMTVADYIALVVEAEWETIKPNLTTPAPDVL
jgi:hypothetical protein